MQATIEGALIGWLRNYLHTYTSKDIMLVAMTTAIAFSTTALALCAPRLMTYHYWSGIRSLFHYYRIGRWGRGHARARGGARRGGAYCTCSDMYCLIATSCCIRASASLLIPACSRPACLPPPPRALLSSYSSNLAFSRTPNCCSDTSASALTNTQSHACQAGVNTSCECTQGNYH